MAPSQAIFFESISLSGFAADSQETQTDKPVPPPVVYGLGWNASREAAGLTLDGRYELDMFHSESAKTAARLTC